MHIVDKLYYSPIFAPILPFRGYFYKIQQHIHDITTDLALISAKSKEKTEENDQFSYYLKNSQIEGLDQKVFELNRNISATVDCQQCGNCCKTLMIVVSEVEADHVSSVLGKNRQHFDQQYLEKGSNGLMIMNTMPCHFLKENSCTIYSNRFEGCHEFPALHLPDFQKRIFTHLMHYERCPIIFNVIEQLKIDLNFEKETI
jgi:Fe-S-cluster containining protein